MLQFESLQAFFQFRVETFVLENFPSVPKGIVVGAFVAFKALAMGCLSFGSYRLFRGVSAKSEIGNFYPPRSVGSSTSVHTRDDSK